ncbi:MAG: AraC family transcriptional regulator [Pseudomonadota bacterium]
MSNALAVSHGDFGRAALYDLDRPITTHAHREGHLIFPVAGGQADVLICDTPVRCDETTAAAVSPWELHSFSPQGSGFMTLVLYIKPMWFLEHTGSSEFALNFGSRELKLSDEIQKLVRKLSSMMISDSVDVMVESLLIELTAKCYETSWVGRKRPCSTTQLRNFSDFRVRRSQQLMKKYIYDHDGLDNLASEVGLSRPHFFKLFKRQTGVTPNVYFNTLRSEQAIDDLMNTDKSVTDIALDLGFASQASFTRFFSLNVGIAPTDYRRVARVS